MKDHLKAFLVVLIFFIFGLSGYFIFIFENKNSEIEYKTEDSIYSIKLPHQEIKLLDGVSFVPSEQKNKIIIVNFWASWCAPCVEEIPSLNELVKKNKNIIVLAFSGDKNREDIQAFMKSFPYFNRSPFYQIWDDNETWIQKFNVIKLPESYVFNRKGEMIKRVSGTINWDTPDSINYFSLME